MPVAPVPSGSGGVYPKASVTSENSKVTLPMRVLKDATPADTVGNSTLSVVPLV